MAVAYFLFSFGLFWEIALEASETLSELSMRLRKLGGPGSCQYRLGSQAGHARKRIGRLRLFACSLLARGRDDYSGSKSSYQVHLYISAHLLRGNLKDPQLKRCLVKISKLHNAKLSRFLLL